MESSLKNSCSVIQYYKGSSISTNNTEVTNSDSFDSKNSVDQDLKEVLGNKNEKVSDEKESFHYDNSKGDLSEECGGCNMVKVEDIEFKVEPINSDEIESKTEVVGLPGDSKPCLENKFNIEEAKCAPKLEKNSCFSDEKNFLDGSDFKEANFDVGSKESPQPSRGRKRKLSSTTINESTSSINSKDGGTNEEMGESEVEGDEDADKPRRRGRKKGKRTVDIIPAHLSSDMVLGYKMLLRFLETPQFSAFHKPFKKNCGIDDSESSSSSSNSSKTDDSKITCLNQIKKKFEDNSYNMVSEFVNDVREMLINIYESRNPVATKRALRLEQILEQRIAQLPNYLRPQCALVLPPDEVNNSHNKIRISKGGGFISLLLEKTEKQRFEKNKEKRKLLAEERKQIKEEQDKDVQEWEKDVLLKGYDEDIKSMWELPAIGHFLYLCTDILNIGEVAQFEVERMLLMPQCSDTLDLIMTALLTNSLVRAKLDRTPSMPYSIWSPLVRTRVVSWYRIWHKEGKNEQKLFEEIGIEPAFWQILGPDINPLDYYYFHEISLFQRVWVLKTLCDVDFVRKKTVYENIRTKTLDELNPVNLGLDRHGNRYVQLKQFCFSDLRIYRQNTSLEGDLTLTEYVENFNGFEDRTGPITIDKVFKDIWESSDKIEVKCRRKKMKTKKQKILTKATPESVDKKNLRQSVRAKQKTYVDWSDSDMSDTDLDTLKKKLTRPDSNTLHRPFSDREFISLSVFRLPRDKVTKPTSRKSNYGSKRLDDLIKNEGAIGDKSAKGETEDVKDDCKTSVLPGEDERSDSLIAKPADGEKSFQNDDLNGDDFDLKEKLANSNLEQVNDDVKFTVKNLQDLKMVFKKGPLTENFSEKSDLISDKSVSVEGKTAPAEKGGGSYKYVVPDHLKPDSNKFYLVVDSIEGLRQLISKFGSHENDLEIITRSTKSKKKIVQNNKSCEVELIERLQKLLAELEPWELDFMKTSRTNKEKMYREYNNFINRPSDFVHPNEAYWMKTYEEPTTSTTASTTSTTTTTTTASSSNDASASTVEKNSGKEVVASTSDVIDSNDQNNSDILVGPRKRTRVTRLQLQPEDKEVDDDDSDFDVDNESNESDDNWVLPTPKRKAKKETPAKTSKYPRRSVGRKLKSSPTEKTESRTSAGEKSQNSSPEKAKKALFWGPRSSDPSEDLNWEKNRQKILEQHNSPVKKVIFKSDEIAKDAKELENIFQKSEEKTATVIRASPKRFTAQIPGNKKPYFSSAQLKAMENSAKQKKRDEGQLVQQKEAAGVSTNLNFQQSENKGTSTTSELLFLDSGHGGPIKVQTYSRLDKVITKPAVGTTQIVNKSKQSQLAQLVLPTAARFDGSSKVQESLKVSTKAPGQIQRPGNMVSTNQTQIMPEARSVIQQKVIGQIQQPTNQVHQIQVEDPTLVAQSKTINTSTSDLILTQSRQWQPKVLSLHTVNQQGKIVSQNPTQVQVQNQSQVPLQTQSQANIQQVIQIDPQKWTTIQQPVEMQGDKQIQQMVISQPKTSTGTSDDLFITDGKLLLKCDNNFIQQYMQKDKVVTLNIHEKFDLKKPLLIVKPKVDSNQSPNVEKGETSSQQQNVLILKPTNVQQNVVSSPVSNIGVPTNFILKEGTQQPQFIKIITSQPLGSNQKIILSPNNITLNSPNVRTTNPTAASDQQTKSPATLRFYRPQIITSNAVNVVQNKTGTVQSPVIVNKIVQIQGSQLDSAKPQLVAGRLVSTSVPTVRMITPIQGGNLAAHTVRLSSQPVQQMKGTSQPQIITASTLNPITIGTTSGNAVRLTSSNSQTVVATSNIQALGAHTSVNSLPLKVAGVQSHQVLQQSSANTLSSTNTGNLGTQTFRLANNIQSVQVQSQPVASPSSLNSVRTTFSGQPVRLAVIGQSQPIKLIVNNSVRPKFIRNVTPVKTNVITNVSQAAVINVTTAPSIRPTGIAGQPVRLQNVVQPSNENSSKGKLQTR